MIEKNPEFLAQLRETQPEATETEVWLLERLIGAAGMVRRLSTHGQWMIGGQDAYQVLDEFLMERYGWKLHWRDDEPKPKRRRAS